MTFLASLTNRIFLAGALLSVVSMAVAIYVVNAHVTREAENELRRSLEEAGTLLEEYRTTQVAQFVREARLIAELPMLKAAVELDDAPTVRPLAEEYHLQIGSDLFVVTNRDGRVLAAFGQSDVPIEDTGNLPPVRSALAGGEATAVWPRAGGVLHVASVPIWIGPDDPEILGSLNVGFHLDEPVAARFADLTHSEIAFASGGRIQASTLPRVHDAAIASLLGSSGVSRIVLGNEEYVAVTRPLSPEAATPAAAAKAPTAVLLRSRTERLRFLNRLHTTLGATALVAVLAATLLGYVVARTITRPLGTITATMREMAGTGDLTRKIALPRGRTWIDEDARLLASTFNTLTDSIARFQQEAAQRERLSALGRLSTVVAHEIRNPLMIIKASLRPLRRGDAPPDRIRAAVSDIEEEIQRLNRIVTEVLDYARPIRFDYAPADLNAVCADAAQATSVGSRGPRIRLDLDRGLGDVVTDAERLRLALVNILTNARQAVSADGAAPSAGSDPIDLATHALEGDRAVVVVRDTGSGIPEDVLPRIFDPYFTTKRTGSGLGLAIARNVVEGLGGTIAVSSRPGDGTEIRIELPRRPPPAAPAPARPGDGT